MFQELNHVELQGIDGGSWKSHVVNLVGVVSGFGTTGAVIGGSFGGPLGAAAGGFVGAHYGAVAYAIGVLLDSSNRRK
ncbi:MULTISPECIES: Blp family class II bacteriocin [Anoxybacillus]|nr:MULTISPECIES: Blp family class II bacteriocin [Anoxybacillus]MBW9218560.1 Blp family class II bacteriocin [Anoxybacillus sp. ST70]MDO0877994.1 Blp family class II bacteriocin [Anoxybacillus gonensis]NNU96399.1 bacteriocin, lactococcin A1 family protein [Anoxybacillus sp. EFIL]